MLNSLLLATDFSEEAGAAARRAASIAGEAAVQGVVVHVLPALPAAVHVSLAGQARMALEAVVDGLRGEGLRFEARLLSGDVPGELLRAAAGFDVVVVGARGEDLLLDFSLGRTSARLVRDSRCPVLVVKRPPEGPYRRVLSAVDYSAASLAAASFAFAIAPDGDIHPVHAYEVPFESTLRRSGVGEDEVLLYRRHAQGEAQRAMEAFAGRLGNRGGRLRPLVIHGYPPKVILQRAEETGAQLIVMGRHAAGAVERAFVGSMSLQVLERAQCDVLVVPEAAP